MTSVVRRRRILSLVGATIVWPAVLTAQGPQVQREPAMPFAERFAVGAVCGVVPGAIPWGIVQFRIDAPVTKRWFIDADVGTVFGTNRIGTGQVPDGAVVDVHAKWMYGARSTGGRTGFVFFGPRVIGAKDIDVRGQVINRRPIVLVDIGWGLDWHLKGGWHAGVEIGGGGGRPGLLFVNGFVLFGPR